MLPRLRANRVFSCPSVYRNVHLFRKRRAALNQAIADHREDALLGEGHFLVMQRAVLETEDQMAFDKTSIFEDLGQLTLAKCLPDRRTYEKIAMDNALWRPHRDRSGI